MKKLTILLVVATVAFSTVVFQCDEESAKNAVMQPEQMEWYSPAVRQKVASYRCFRETMDSTLESLERGDASLADAVSRVYDAAQTWWPTYLQETKWTELGQTPRERIARNLVGHLRNLAEMKPELAARMQALEAELNAFVSEMENASQ